MSIYSVFIYEKHNLRDWKPEWMSAERYDYCEQMSPVTVPSKGLLKRLGELLSSR